MTKTQLIVSTCGTSLLTNNRNQNERNLINRYANKKDRSEIPDEDVEALKTIIGQVRDTLPNASLNDIARLSAELNALIKFYGGQSFAPHDHHYLICTDTWLGEEAATLVEGWLLQQGCRQVHVRRQTDLQTANLQTFQLALSDLVKWCQNELDLKGYRTAGYYIVFNMTGGFKSVQGFLQTLAMFYADESIYIFESGKELLRIPRLPVVMDARRVVSEHMTTFRRLANGLVVDNESTIGIPETMLLRIDQEVCLSAWGQLVWEETKKELYGEQIYPSPDPKISYSKRFEESIRGLSKERIITINRRIDDLACHLVKTNQNIRSLDFKKLQGNPKPPSTHECDAWHDQDTKRLFGHFEANVFVLDCLDHALHKG